MDLSKINKAVDKFRADFGATIDELHTGGQIPRDELFRICNSTLLSLRTQMSFFKDSNVCSGKTWAIDAAVRRFQAVREEILAALIGFKESLVANEADQDLQVSLFETVGGKLMDARQHMATIKATEMKARRAAARAARKGKKAKGAAPPPSPADEDLKIAIEAPTAAE